MKQLLSIAIACFCLSVSSVLAADAPQNPLETLKKEHPRIILTDDLFEHLQETLKTNKTAQEYKQRLEEYAESLLKKPLVDYIIVGPRLLTQSRNCLDRVYTFGLLYKLDGDKKWFERLKQEVFAAISFKDWNPSHFLDTAEMSHAIGVAYDWFYDDWSSEERAQIRKGLIEKGLKVAKSGYENNAWWSKSHHNWNQVCNGGIGIGALAVADEEPELATFLLQKSVSLMPLALQSYAPDGGWAEGPGYWHYATRYTVYFLAALDAALGKDFGLSDYPGMAEAGRFRMHFCSPVGQTFNYADAGSGIGGAHEMFWLSKRYNQPMFAFQQREILKKRTPSALDLIWFSDAGTDPAKSGFPLDGVYTGIDVAMFRSAWNDPNAIFVGFKGGDNKANHSHLDLGTFVLDAEGVRWAIDLGSDNYNMPGYFGKQRWTYFRLNTLSHNTLVVNNSNQDPKAPAPIIDSHFDDKFSYAVADLSKGYHDLQKAHRGVALINRSTVLVQDEYSSDKAVDVQWGMMTDSNIKLDGSTAVLTKDGKTLTAKILSPSNAKFEVIDGNPPKPQRQLKNAKKLVINLNSSKGEQTIAVTFQPRGFSKSKMEIKALSDWEK